MGTISHKIAVDVVKGDYNDDGITKVVIYNNMFDGGLTFACVAWREDQRRYENSPACRQVRTVWEYQKDGYRKDAFTFVHDKLLALGVDTQQARGLV